MPFSWGCSLRADTGRGVLPHPLPQADGDGELDLLVCDTCYVPASQMGGGWCNKPVVALVTQMIPGLCLLHSLGGVMQAAKTGWVPGEFAFNLCPEVQDLWI